MRALPALLASLPGLLGAGVAPDQTPPRRHDLVLAAAALHDWDQRRQHAWAADDAGALRRLYLPTSGARRADVRLLRAYDARGLVVRRIVTQVFALTVLRSDEGRLTIRVLDRVAGGEVYDGTRARPLGVTRPVVRRVVLVHRSGGWRVAAVTAVGHRR
jgi:hypothetical protein